MEKSQVKGIESRGSPNQVFKFISHFKLVTKKAVFRPILKLELLLKSLITPELIAQCPKCDKEFKLCDSLLFDGTKKFPDKAEKTRLQLIQELAERQNELEKRKFSADVTAEKRAIDVGFGKIIEKFIPAFKDLKLQFAECRPLFDPIDVLVFNGLLNRKVDHITFLEIKSGDSNLNKHQRIIRDAILENKVDMKVL
jgi:predicted Holliday junction resolvase-like endonuclease